MNKNKHCISYQTIIDNNGYVYKQAIRITFDEYHKLNDNIRSEIALEYPRSKEYVHTDSYKTFLKPISIVKKWSTKTSTYALLNMTQTRFINIFLKLTKLKMDRNTYLIIRKGR